MDNGLRITDTNSANDSKGRALGFEGNDFLYVVGGIIGSIGMFLLLYALLAVAPLTAVLLSVPVFVIPLLWVVLFRHNKPEGYAEDFFDYALNREGFAFVQDQLASSESFCRYRTR
jgi:hypothetical protein